MTAELFSSRGVEALMVAVSLTAVAEDFESSKKGLVTHGGLDGFTPQHTDTEAREHLWKYALYSMRDESSSSLLLNVMSELFSIFIIASKHYDTFSRSFQTSVSYTRTHLTLSTSQIINFLLVFHFLH